jgi:hypothetical protein
MPTTLSHGYSALVIRWCSCPFLGGKRISIHYCPCFPGLPETISLTLRHMALRLLRLQLMIKCTSTFYVLVAPPGLCNVNGPMPINLYLCFLSRMIIGSIEDLHEVGVPRCSTSPSGHLESRLIKTIISSGL